jgi:V/A-type H+-transporting ATPase subunit A
MHTGIRIIDALFPIAYGGTACNPGPFGAGKTVLQHSLAKHTNADVIIIAACGERAGEAVEIFRDFPELVDPKTGKSLMDRTYIVGNTSSMPVAAREASVYIAATVGEYYRKQGLHVLMLADSTSRWAQAMREISGRKEEIPGPEAFPMYISTLISALYDRAGVEELNDGSVGSLSMIGTVSPAGGNFDEPVTQATLMSTGSFWALSRARSDARKYPAIDPEESTSKYESELERKRVQDLLNLMNERKKIASNLVLMGEKGITNEAFIVYQKGELADAVFLQQNSFHEVDGVTNPERLRMMFDVLREILDHPVNLRDKEQIRSHFNYIRQAFLDWNYTAMDHPDFKVQLNKIREIVKQQTYATEDL